MKTLKITRRNGYYSSESAYEYSSSSESVSGIIFDVDANGLAKIVNNDRYFNAVLSFLNDNPHEIISKFGGIINLNEICYCLSIGTVTDADIEEYKFTHEYNAYARNRASFADNDVRVEYRKYLSGKLDEAGGGVTAAMNTLCEEFGISHISENLINEKIEFFRNNWRKFMDNFGEKELVSKLLAMGSLLPNDVPYVLFPDKTEEFNRWKNYIEPEPIIEDYDYHNEEDEHFDIVIEEIDFKPEGILVLRETHEQSYCND